MKTATKTNYQAIYDEADLAGVQAAIGHQPAAMVVYETQGLTDTPLKGGKEWFVEGGVCGFAWVNIKPARGGFVNWLKAQGTGRLDGYAGGWTIWVHDFGQSMERKEKYATAFAKVLQTHGIKAYAQARMD